MDQSTNQQEGNFPKGIGNPARRALLAAGYSQLEQLAECKEADLKRLHGMGPKALNELRRALSELGMSFAEDKKTVE